MTDQIIVSVLKRITSKSISLSDLINAAQAFTAEGRSDLANEVYKVWCNFNADDPQRYAILFNQAVLLSNTGDLAEAETALREAIALNPDFMPAYVNLGGILERRGDPDGAIALWLSGIERLARVTGETLGYKTLAYKQISRVLMDHARSSQAEAMLLTCLEHDANQRDAAGQYVPLRLSQCKWPIISPTEKVDRATLMRGVQPLSMAAYTDDPMLLLASAWRYVKDDVDKDLRPGMDRSHDRRNAVIDLSNRRLRVGYVSSDLRDHAIGYLMAEMFELHDRTKVEVFAYYCGPASNSSHTHRIRAAVEHWVDITPMSDDAAAARIAADGIDVLVDVNGLTKDARTAVFGRRPAPIQINWLGFPASIASPYHNYIIADDWIIPPDYEMFYTEKVLRLPCYQANDRKRVLAPHRPTRAEVGLPEQGVVFCCFNGAQKISRFTFDRWMTILQHTPGSVLWLLDASPETNARLGDHAEQRGVARSRIVFAPKMANPAHLARYPLADLMLDTSPYGAHTTASDALWMGVPVITLSGRSFASRVCGSLVRAAGLPELVCEDPDAYVRCAVALAAAPDQMRRFRERLEAERSTCALFDMDKLTASLERLYFDVCQTHQAGRTPQPDLRNLDAYLNVGVTFDHDAQELTLATDYQRLYRTALAGHHWIRPIPADTRLWREDDIAAYTTPPQIEPAPHSKPHPLLQLSDLYNAASRRLCFPLTAETEAEVDRLAEEAAALDVRVPPGPDYEGWLKHYRLAFEAIDLAHLREPPPTSESCTDVVFATATGADLTLVGVKAAAKRVGAEAVFFVAADESYVAQYARWYVLSVLKNADVPALVIVHVIGGAGRLGQIAPSVGVHDPRLIYAGDAFDAAKVVTRCHDTPPKNEIARPVAHFQSARFQRLGAILRALKRPVFTSDIDLLLQRGVSDLLARCKSADLVLNENTSNTNAGSRLTANLVLTFPTPKALVFVDFLEGYLNRMLSRADVSRWIDQFGLTMAYQALLRSSSEPNVQYFDTDLDINNVMYPAYQDNPFRFLSLYHGFDMTSLEAHHQRLIAPLAAE
jgi:predicted O-linked N-acetylglucosamine transferase (SPINDLY family)